MNKVPNETTQEAIRELEAGEGVRCKTLDELMADLEAEEIAVDEGTGGA